MSGWWAEFGRQFRRLFAVGFLLALAACLGQGVWTLATR